ncbi:hypothetical protein RHGRI_011498 [Rhododendron griersonianum]|uniref:Uncharacterized protein n=1 Tax=Rhododendron griersonianum TaxID=479676 RepID=A0AAV6KMR0_9ERIC|nr:hypothetical protein RHGRI_011498 [Rhododendron griersonianum]
MANGVEGSNHPNDEERGVQALWAYVHAQEAAVQEQKRANEQNQQQFDEVRRTLAEMQQSFARLYLGGHRDRDLGRVRVNENLPLGCPDGGNDPINLRRQPAYVDDSSDEELGNWIPVPWTRELKNSLPICAKVGMEFFPWRSLLTILL